MASKGLPTARERRRMLAESSPRLPEVAREYLSQGRQAEALECLEVAPDNGLAEEIVAGAVSAGDFLLWRRAISLLGRPAQPGELERLAQAAQDQGKSAFAALALALSKS